MATSVSVVLHRTVPLLMLLISENMSMVHCTCSGGGHTEIEPGDCQSLRFPAGIMAMVQAISSQSLQQRCVFACLHTTNTDAGHAKCMSPGHALCLDTSE